ncbi:FliA/WhiG family RNA polymerase sigma factor [Nocardioides ochotonae]|uniref:FliA/WhiG family RNA polymerase sigma factor n=1 Tax=Nocardioides ochotonae TaxID=2685869 RepID=UPI001AA0029C|nr:FliA/WhiG family RNA polymerase sigma factor [Nocardioides ochotonae]
MGTQMPVDDVDDLWRRFKHDHDPQARDQLVLQFSPLVKYVVGRLRSSLPASVDSDDLTSDGVLGLLDAVDKFDPERGLQFQTYAVSRIRGAIVDGLRSTDWVPRSVREKIRDLNAAQTTLERRLGRSPDDTEVAAELGIGITELQEMYAQTSYTNVLSLEASTTGEDDPAPAASYLPGPGEDWPDGFLQAVRSLPERDQILIALYYWDRLTLAEIGQVLGVTESRVSQLHSRATLTLRRRIAEQADA